MYVIKHTKSPRGYHVGYIKGDGRFHFFAGNTEQKMFARGRKVAYDLFKAPASKVFVERVPMAQDAFPHELIDPRWHAVWWTGIRKDGKPATAMGWSRVKKVKRNNNEKDNNKPKSEPKFEFHITRNIGNQILVFGCVKVAEYNLETNIDDKEIELPFVNPIEEETEI